MQGISLSGLGYYFDGLPSADSGEGTGPSAVSRYGGATAARVGIAGSEVFQPDLAALLIGRGVLAHCGVGVHRVRHAFVDVVFTCPKSVSLLFGLATAAERDEILAAHVSARDAVLSYLERTGAWVKAPTGTREVSRAEGFVWAPFIHHVNRRGDPHLHSHVVIANLVPSQKRGWSPLHSGALFSERSAAGELYRAALRFELAERLDLAFRTRSAKGSDVAGFSDSVLDAFSRRDTSDIARQRESSGRSFSSSRSRRSFPAMEKPPHVPLEELRDGWESRATRLGVIINRDVEMTSLRPKDAATSATDLVTRVDLAVRESISAFDAAFARADLITAVGATMAYGAPVAVIEASVDLALHSLETNRNDLVGTDLGATARYDRRQLDRFVNAQTAALASNEVAMLRDALGQSDLVEVCNGQTPWPRAAALVAISTERDGMRAYATLRSARAVAVQFDRPLRLVCPTREARSLFETATGAEIPASGSRADRTRAGLTLVADAWRLSVGVRANIVEVARARDDLVVMCDVARPRLDRSSQSGKGVVDFGAMTQFERRYEVAANVEAVVFDALDRALFEITSLQERLGARARVVMSRRLRCGVLGNPQDIVGETSRSRRESIGRSVDADAHEQVLVVFGDAYGLSPHELELSRIHILVAPPEGHLGDERALAFSLSGWTRARSWRVPANQEISARFAWGWKRLVDHDRRGVWQEHEFSPERIAISRRERESGDARAKEQSGRATRTIRDGIGREPTLAP